MNRVRGFYDQISKEYPSITDDDIDFCVERVSRKLKLTDEEVLTILMKAFKPKLPKVVSIKVDDLRRRNISNFEEWLKLPGSVYIGRHVRYVKGTFNSIFANPFTIKKYGLDGCLSRYQEYVLNNPKILQELPKLYGKELGCWCKSHINPNAKCHGDVLKKLLE